jgi:hypothetical protein
MTNYVNIKFLGDWCDVDVEYEVIDGDDSVGLAEDYEFTATATDEKGNEIDITDDLTRSDVADVVEAIRKDLQRSEYDND